MPASRFRSLVDRFTADIRSGLLPPGSRLPALRDLAWREGVAPGTAARAYAELVRRGLAVGEVGRGTFVRDAGRLDDGSFLQGEARAAVDLTFNSPLHYSQLGDLRAALRLLATTGDLDGLMRYQPHAGRMRDREVVAGWLTSKGVPASASRTLLTAGAQHGLAVCLLGCLPRGATAATERLTYPGFKAAAALAGANLVAVPVTGDGLDVEALGALTAKRKIDAVYLMPTLHNPLGGVMPIGNRYRVIEIARKAGAIIIEDAAYAFAVEDAPPPIAALAPDITIHVGGFAKNVGAGLRCGYIVAPDAVVPRAIEAIRSTAWSAPVLPQAVLTQWIEDGVIAKLEIARRADFRTRRALAESILGDAIAPAHPAAPFCWVTMPAGRRADDGARSLADRGVLVSTAEAFAIGPPSQAVRLALATPTLDALRSALALVEHELRSQ
jgi:DNA-binding transcriptional MocR family regulator